MLGDSSYDWDYHTTPQPGLHGRTVAQPRGKIIGGSSAINSFAMIYPNQTGIDVWGELGNKGWYWRDLEPYFRRFQTVCQPDKGFDNSVLPTVSPPDEAPHGPIQASLPMRSTELHRAWVETFRGLGLENVRDPLEGRAIGGYISTCHITADRRERSHAGVAFLDESTTKLENLDIVTGALVEGIEFQPRTGTAGNSIATRIWYQSSDGSLHHARVSKEVILAAGTLSSPCILERSGIGSPDILQEHGIHVVYANSNIGENLQDHIRAGLSFRATPGVEPSEPEDREKARREYQEHRTGPLAERACFTFAHLPLLPFLGPEEEEDLRRTVAELLKPDVSPDPSNPDHQRTAYIRRMILSPHEATSTAFLSRQPSTPSEINGRKDCISLFAMLSHSLSRGNIHISSPDPSIPPTIDPKYYSHPLDLEIHSRHLQFLAKIAASKPLSDYLIPREEALTLDDAKEICRKSARTNYHPCGSCAMMPEAAGGVVDERLVVYGTRNVRVVDASVFPVIPRGNIVATVYTLAEKAADLIIGKWAVV